MIKEIPPGNSGNVVPFTHCDTTSTFDVLLETSKGTRIRYEFDHGLKVLRCKYILEPGLVFPISFGSFPHLKHDDDQKFQAVLLDEDELKGGCVFQAKILGSIRMRLHEALDSFVIVESLLVTPKDSFVASELRDINHIAMVSKLLIQKTYLSFPLQRQDFEILEWCDSRKAIYHLQQNLDVSCSNFAKRAVESSDHSQ